MLLLILKSSACLATFMIFYKLFLEKERMHSFKRFYLLGSLLISIVIPFITFTQYIEPVPVHDLVSFQAVELTEDSRQETTWQNYIPTILWSLYTIGVMAFSFRFVRNLKDILSKIKTNPKHKYHTFTNVLLQDLIPPHTFFNYIFVNKTKYEQKQIPKEVLLHEQTHAKQKHALDIIIIELLQIVFWFNPLIYLIKKDIKLNHEFLADQAVINKGINVSQYKETLLAFSSHAKEPELANAINYSSIKKRFTVMKTKTSKHAIWLRSLILLPILAILIYSFSEKTIIEKEVTLVEPITLQETNKEIILDSISLQKVIDYNKKWDTSTPEFHYTKQTFWIKNKNGAKVAKKYFELSEQNKRKRLIFPPNDFEKKQISPKEFVNLSDKSTYIVRINGNIIDNKNLKKYKNIDFVSFSKSKISKLAKIPQKHHYNLITKSGFKANIFIKNNKRNSKLQKPINIQKRATKEQLAEYNSLVKPIMSQPENRRIFKQKNVIRIKYLYSLMSEEQKEKYAEPFPKFPPPPPIQEIATKEQIAEYNSLAKSISSQPEGQQIIKVKDLKRLKHLYNLMSAQQKKNAEPFPEIAPMPPPVPASIKVKEVPTPSKKTIKRTLNDGELIEIREVPPPLPPTKAISPNAKPSKGFLIAQNKYKSEADAYAKAVSAYIKSKEGNTSNLKEMYKRTINLYNNYTELAKKETVITLTPPPPPPAKKKQ